VNGDAELVRDIAELATLLRSLPKPQLSAMSESSDGSLRDEPPEASLASLSSLEA
jgi:hypothetical protein